MSRHIPCPGRALPLGWGDSKMGVWLPGCAMPGCFGGTEPRSQPVLRGCVWYTQNKGWNVPEIPQGCWGCGAVRTRPQGESGAGLFHLLEFKELVFQPHFPSLPSLTHLPSPHRGWMQALKPPGSRTPHRIPQNPVPRASPWARGLRRCWAGLRIPTGEELGRWEEGRNSLCQQGSSY